MACLGNPVEYSITQLAEMVLKATGSSSVIEYRPLPVDDPKVRQPDISRARLQLEWEPGIAVQDGLARTIEYFRSQTL